MNRFIDDRDGRFRAYTVVDSPREKDGWYAWSRHSLCKTNGHWVILSSFDVGKLNLSVFHRFVDGLTALALPPMR